MWYLGDMKWQRWTEQGKFGSVELVNCSVSVADSDGYPWTRDSHWNLRGTHQAGMMWTLILFIGLYVCVCIYIYIFVYNVWYTYLYLFLCTDLTRWQLMPPFYFGSFVAKVYNSKKDLKAGQETTGTGILNFGVGRWHFMSVLSNESLCRTSSWWLTTSRRCRTWRDCWIQRCNNCTFWNMVVIMVAKK